MIGALRSCLCQAASKGLAGSAPQHALLATFHRFARSNLQTTTAAKQKELQKELTDAAAAALSSGKIAGSWSAVRQASTRIGRTASSAGLAKVATLIAETASRGVLGAGQQQAEQPPRQVPVIQQQAQQAQQQAPQQQALQQQGPREIPVINLAPPMQQQQQQQQQQQHAAAAPAGSGRPAEALAGTLPAADAAGLEGFYSEAAEAAAAAVGAGAADAGAAAGEPGGAAGAEGQQAWQPQQEQEPVVPCLGADAPMAEAASAQEAAAHQAAPAGPVAAGNGSNGAAGSPEHLYPPGAPRSEGAVLGEGWTAPACCASLSWGIAAWQPWPSVGCARLRAPSHTPSLGCLHRHPLLPPLPLCPL